MILFEELFVTKIRPVRGIMFTPRVLLLVIKPNINIRINKITLGLGLTLGMKILYFFF